MNPECVRDNRIRTQLLSQGPHEKPFSPSAAGFDLAAAGALNMPIAIHSSNPEAFFPPTDRYNERYEELNAHPDWSFHGRDFHRIASGRKLACV